MYNMNQNELYSNFIRKVKPFTVKDILMEGECNYPSYSIKNNSN